MGFNSRLDTIQAAVLSVKLRHLDRWNEQRNQVADRYRAALRSRTDLRVVDHAAWTTRHAYHLFVVRSLDGQRDRIVRTLQARGIGVGVHYPIAIHQQEAFKQVHDARDLSFPATERLASQIFSLPICGDLRDDEAATVVDELVGALDAEQHPTR